jgi:hypothetical protein
MWQRKQSVLLALGALLAFASWLFPIASYTGDLGVYKLRTYGLFLPDGTESTMVGLMLPFEVLHSVLGSGMLVTILLYGNRPRQARVVRGLWMLQLPVIAFQYITMNSTLAYLARQGTIDQSMGLTFFLPMVVLVLVFIAERMIRSDEELVRSTERLR